MSKDEELDEDFDINDISLSDGDMNDFKDEYGDEMKELSKAKKHPDAPKMSLTDKDWDKDYSPNFQRLRPNMRDMFHTQTETFKRDYSGVPSKYSLENPPPDEDYEANGGSWNIRMMEQRRGEFNYQSEDEDSQEHTTTHPEAGLMEGLWR